MNDLSHHHLQYAGFLRRSFAFILDMIFISLITSALILALFGMDYLQQLQTLSITALDWRITLIEQLLPAIWSIGFWFTWKATPAKLLLDCQVVDAKTSCKASFGQLLLRYLGYLLSLLPLGLGFIWILIDDRNQGWHDKLSSTIVILQDESRLKLEVYS